MIRELRANQATLVALRSGYGVFAFTGGELPTGQCGLEAIVSYLKCPFATDRVSTGEVDRYGHLVVAVMRLGQETLPPRPRTLRCRHQIAEAFIRVSSEARSLGAALESTFSGLLRELGPLLHGQATTSLENGR
jgi:hypothetical protein